VLHPQKLFGVDKGMKCPYGVEREGTLVPALISIRAAHFKLFLTKRNVDRKDISIEFMH